MAGNMLTQSALDAGFQSTPDMVALSQMQDPIVVVTKVIESAGNKRKDQLVINGFTGMNANAILALQDDLPDVNKHPKGGPGTYKFEVTDQATSAKQAWQIRLGGVGVTSEGSVASTAISRPMGVGAVVTTPPVAPRGPAVVAATPPIPVGPDVENLGNGFTYHARLNLLTVPDGRVFQWRAGQPLPDLNVAPTNAAASTPILSTFQNSTAVPPEMEALRLQNQTMQQEMARMREDQREQARQNEIAALRETQQKQIEAMQTRFETLVEKLSSKPAEDPRLAALERQLTEQARESAIRNEMNAKIEAITSALRDERSKGPDPMIPLLTSMMQQQAATAQENMRIMREATSTQLAAAQASALTPEKLIALLREQAEMAQNSGSAVLNEKFMGVINGLFDTVTRFRQAESAMSGSGTDWMSVFSMLAEKGGNAISMLGQAKAREAGAVAAKANAAAVAARAQIEIAKTRALEVAAVTRANDSATTAAPALPPSEAARDELATRMFGPAAAVNATPQPNSAAAVAAAEVVAPVSAVSTTMVSPPTHAPAKRGRPKQAEGVTRLKKASLEELKAAYANVSDEQFFGPFFSTVLDLRKELETDPNGYDGDAIAAFVIEARQFIAEAVEKEGKVPMVVEMLHYGRYDYMFFRMMPTQSSAFIAEAATALQAKIAAEQAGADA